MPYTEEFLLHLQSGHTTVCRAWRIRRKDGTEFGFTDHDQDLVFDGVTFKAGTGLTAASLQQSTGLSVDNTEAVGILSDASVTDADIHAGRFDGAEVLSWLVNWADPDQRVVQFRGSLGELKLEAGAFHAELRGLSEALNQSQGRVYQRSCSAALADAQCRADLSSPDYTVQMTVRAMSRDNLMMLSGTAPHADGWFVHGRFEPVDGAAAGLVGHIKSDRMVDGERRIELWEELRATVVEGDTVRLVAGCDKRLETCRTKFSNFSNFRGFPHIPGEDWLVAYPRKGKGNTGRSRY